MNQRTLEQNALLWSLLNQLSEQLPWHGKYRSAEDWKTLVTASLRGYEIVPGIDPGHFVVLGMSTSKMKVEEFSNVIELIYAFAANHDVTFRESE